MSLFINLIESLSFLLLAALILTASASWLDRRPLLRSDLEHEPEGFAGLGIELHLAL